MSIGLAIIARDEQVNLPVLLESVEGAFDRVALLDTGSTDDTVKVFTAWAREQAGMTYSVGHFEWVDDFAAARNAADHLLIRGTTEPTGNEAPLVDWACWADCDDTISHPERLRQLAADAPAEVGGLVFGYNYAQSAEGVCICHLKRERLVRARFTGGWIGCVHEAQPLPCPTIYVPDEVCQWVHRKQSDTPEAATASNERNLRILQAWNAREPDNPRVLNYLGAENASRGDLDVALHFWNRYLELKTGWDQERAQVHRRMGMALIARGQPNDALRCALDALAVLPEWPETYLTLAEASLALGRFDHALSWARQAEELGAPDTLLIVNPLDFTFLPQKLQACALGDLGRFDEAVATAERAMHVYDGDGQLYHVWAHCKAQAKREHTAATYVMAGQQLVAHDEQLKALTLLEECVPHFAQDHPAVTALRSEVRERLMWIREPELFARHYKEGGSKPEDFHDDERAAAICEQLPRVGFLLDGLAEQREAAA